MPTDVPSPELPLRLRAAVLAVLLVAVLTLALAVDVPGVTAAQRWLPDRGAMGWLVGVGALSVALALPTPRSALSLLAGSVFGLTEGLGVVLVGGLIGAMVGFAASRWLAADLLRRWAGSRVARVDELFRRHGFAAVLVARLSPAPPFAVVSYAAGVGDVGVRPYLLGTAIGIVPGSVLYVSVGASVMSASPWTQRLGQPLLVALVLLVGAAVVIVWRVRRRRATSPRRPQ